VMPRLLAVGHVTRDRLAGGEALGGSAAYAALTARALGWEAAVLTAAGPDFDPDRELPGVAVFSRASPVTTRFRNDYDSGIRRQVLTARALDVELSPLPREWTDPDVLLLGPIAGEVRGALAPAFAATVVGALAQGWLRDFDADGRVGPREWTSAGRDLEGVHVLALSQHDLPDAEERAADFLSHVPIVVLTRGWRGLVLFSREGVEDVPSLPRAEVDPTGAGDVFAAAFLMRYHEAGDTAEAAAFGACAASCVVEGVGASRLGSRAEVERRLVLRERFIEEEGEIDE
jgi:sugar/nucleoside kinase (ribokinase family)